jgi:hypothetical protein
MGLGLFAIAEDGQPMGVRPRQGVGGDRAGGGGADGGDFTRVHHADRRAGLGIKQQHEALVRLPALREVLGIDADQFSPERLGRPHGARHDPERPPVCQRDDLPQQL